MTTFDEWMGRKREDPWKLPIEAVEGIDRYDRRDVERIAKEMRDFRLSRRHLSDRYDVGHESFDEAFLTFLKSLLSLRDPSGIRPDHLIKRRMLEELMKLPEYERLRSWSEGDPITSGMAAVNMSGDIETLLDKAKTFADEARELMRQQQELMAAEEGERTFEQMIEDWTNRADLNDPDVQARLAELADMLNELAKDMAEMRAAVQAASDQLDDKVNNAVSTVLPGMGKAMGAAADDAQAFDAAMRAWGQDPGVVQMMNATERIKLAERLHKMRHFQQLTDLVGKFKRIAMAEQTRKVYWALEEVYDVGVGNDLNRLLPSELGALTNPLRKLDFYRRYSEGKLMQYEMRGEEKVGKGGIVCATDMSGSMAGDPEVFAKAVGMALMSIAKEQKRSFYGVHFSSPGDLKAFDFRDPDKMTLDAVLEYASHFWNGGTDYMGPLTACLKVLQEEEHTKGVVEGDIVFVTDGECNVTDRWLAEFKKEQERLGFKIWGVLIDLDVHSEPFWTICDGNAVTISDLLSGDDIRPMFRNI